MDATKNDRKKIKDKRSAIKKEKFYNIESHGTKMKRKVIFISFEKCFGQMFNPRKLVFFQHGQWLFRAIAKLNKKLECTFKFVEIGKHSICGEEEGGEEEDEKAI